MIACLVTSAKASAFSSNLGCADAIFSAASATSVDETFNSLAVSLIASLNTLNLSPVNPVIAESEANASSFSLMILNAPLIALVKSIIPDAIPKADAKFINPILALLIESVY